MIIDASSHRNSGEPSTVIRYTYSLEGDDAVQLERRLLSLKSALAVRGGHLTSVQRRPQRGGRSRAIVRYEVPTSADASAAGAPGCSARSAPATDRETT